MAENRNAEPAKSWVGKFSEETAKAVAVALVGVFAARWLTGWSALAYLQVVVVGVAVVAVPTLISSHLRKHSRWVAALAAVASVPVVMALGSLSFWTQVSSDFPGALCTDGVDQILRNAAVRGTPANTIEVVGEPLVVVDLNTRGVQAALRFTWMRDDGRPTRRIYSGRAVLSARGRPVLNGDGFGLDAFQVDDVSIVPVLGPVAYELGWLEIPTLLAEISYIEEWLGRTLDGDSGPVCEAE